ncbi:N-alpha-acetyltransferase 60 [Tyrophagus putrescentiae]|nr:N-alpha-acetyltransferase 60 [Tyrophagus putrescentiae]
MLSGGVQPTVSTCDAANLVKLRHTCPTDIDVVKELCKQWFPIKYPDSWYEDITGSNKFYTLVATVGDVKDTIIGLLVAEIKPYARCNHEDIGLLVEGSTSSSSTSNTASSTSSPRVAYILTLGVVGQWRRHGVATLLLSKLTESLTANPMLEDVKAVYLHVLTTNTAAIHFYEKMAFRRHRFLPLYYLINSAAADGYCYALYINGGRPPPTLLGRLLRLLRWSSGLCRGSVVVVLLLALVAAVLVARWLVADVGRFDSGSKSAPLEAAALAHPLQGPSVHVLMIKM